MELRTGKVVKGAIVLNEEDDEELELVRKGVAEAERGELVDARAFLRGLQRHS
ncbi:hypothetical protein [Enhygromyxa salina]|uniref:Uncharacterized protein n=1 Tax=Enhygromyxa salina TaxID=215803 RepID=A0A2S9XN39_9BACT|nr:hypothetical protein [Enhygromyxa salina]PRP94287.1 hypothetical protein ENSA7_78240 [Enhygromyxa salina]